MGGKYDKALSDAKRVLEREKNPSWKAVVRGAKAARMLGLYSEAEDILSRGSADEEQVQEERAFFEEVKALDSSFKLEPPKAIKILDEKPHLLDKLMYLRKCVALCMLGDFGKLKNWARGLEDFGPGHPLEAVVMARKELIETVVAYYTSSMTAKTVQKRFQRILNKLTDVDVREEIRFFKEPVENVRRVVNESYAELFTIDLLQLDPRLKDSRRLDEYYSFAAKRNAAESRFFEAVKLAHLIKSPDLARSAFVEKIFEPAYQANQWQEIVDHLSDGLAARFPDLYFLRARCNYSLKRFEESLSDVEAWRRTWCADSRSKAWEQKNDDYEWLSDYAKEGIKSAKMLTSTHYDSLGIERSSSSSEIKAAFRAKALEHHPDKSGDEVKFREINEAYSVLREDDSRREYDAELRRLDYGGSSDGAPMPKGPHSYEKRKAMDIKFAKQESAREAAARREWERRAYAEMFSRGRGGFSFFFNGAGFDFGGGDYYYDDEDDYDDEYYY